jgi:16S rRNA (cytosine1402-N4)-methyltransferase
MRPQRAKGCLVPRKRPLAAADNANKTRRQQARGAGVGPHVPVLLDEVLESLGLRPDGLYVDATFGRGGHSRAVLARLGPDGRLVGVDRDPAAVAAGEELAREDGRFRIVHGRIGALAPALAETGYVASAYGVIADLGVSSPQLEDPSRGFGFRVDGPLDMRMDPGAGPSAAEWLARADAESIADVLWRYGEERQSRRIAAAILRRRDNTPIRTTRELADTVAGVVRGDPGRHPATRTFQAIRIHINDELGELEAFLRTAPDLLAVGGRLAVISFHSLEDRLVKRAFRRLSSIDPALRDLPVIPPTAEPRFALHGRAIRPGDAELARNPRARSATLRALERLRS